MSLEFNKSKRSVIYAVCAAALALAACSAPEPAPAPPPIPGPCRSGCARRGVEDMTMTRPLASTAQMRASRNPSIRSANSTSSGAVSLPVMKSSSTRDIS